MTQLTVHPYARGSDVRHVAMAGEVDISTCAQFATGITDAIRHPEVNHVVVDLDDVTFIDAQAVHALMRCRWAAARHGTTLTVANAHDIVERVLAVTGVMNGVTDPDASDDVADLDPDGA
ncbi:anti-sigma B factor antagonist [Hamadaea flava]|uniref:Anti-sigma factor antagonist n=1 Tax=Hamadaea flava TaxID=1742688 RepID=A0ABV8LMJ0_9ACTN|nr:STAS domain-containing protein [Hamadaea flava]MCP2323221.1 anti-sigma B factor antagonist [Hamadaea flava]